MAITTTYDHEADALLVQFGARKGMTRTVVVESGVHLDIDPDGRIVSLEVLDASARLIADALVGLDDGTEWLLLSDAAAIAELSPVTLRGQLNKGRIVGEKRGRDWFITRHALDTYLDDVEQQRTGSFDAIVETTTQPLTIVTSLPVPDRRFEATRSPRVGVQDELVPSHATRGGLFSMATNQKSSRPIVQLASKVISGRKPTSKSAKTPAASVLTQGTNKAKKKGK